MADTNDFVFEFELKGEKEVNVAIDDLRAAIKDLTALLQEMNKAGSSGLTDEEKKLRIEEKRFNMKLKEDREDRLKQGLELRKERQDDWRQNKKTRDKKAEISLESAQLRLEQMKTKERENQNVSLASYIGKILTLGVLLKGMQKLIEASGQIRGYNLAATSTGLNATDIKQFGYATKAFGGSEQQATSAVMNLGSRLQAAKRGDDTSLFQALGRAGVGFTVDDLTSPFKLMATVSREMKKWTNPEDIKQGMDILREIFDEPTLLMLKDGFDKNFKAAQDFVMVRPEEERAVEQLYNDIKNLQSVMREFWQIAAIGFNEGTTANIKEWADAIRGSKEEIKLFWNALGKITDGISSLMGGSFGKIFGVAKGVGKATAGIVNADLKTIMEAGNDIEESILSKGTIGKLLTGIPSAIKDYVNVPTTVPSVAGSTTNNMTGGTVNYTSNMTVNVSSAEEGNTFAQQNKQGDISVMEKMSGALGVPFRRSLNNNTMGGG